jgi:hypothetical protein
VGVLGSPGQPAGVKVANSSSVQDGAFAKNVGQAVVDWILERLSDYHKRCVISPRHLSESRSTLSCMTVWLGTVPATTY